MSWMNKEKKSIIVCIWAGNTVCTCLSKGTCVRMHVKALINLKCSFSGAILRLVQEQLHYWFRDYHISQGWQACEPVSVTSVFELQVCIFVLGSFTVGSGDRIQSPMLLPSTLLRRLCSSSYNLMPSSQYPISPEFHYLAMYGSSTRLKASAKRLLCHLVRKWGLVQCVTPSI